MKRLVLVATMFAVLSIVDLRAGPAFAFDGTALASPESAAVSGAASGYQYRMPETRAIQDDDEINPAFLWIEDAAEAWSRVEGAAGAFT